MRLITTTCTNAEEGPGPGVGAGKTDSVYSYGKLSGSFSFLNGAIVCIISVTKTF